MARSKIIQLPSSWLSQKEKAFAYNAFFKKEEKAALEAYSQINQRLLKKAKAIVVDLVKPDGYLGDTIRDSRLTEIIIKNYPQKLVFECSNYSELLGKHQFIVGIKKKQSKLLINYRQTQDAPLQKIAFNENEVLRIVKISPRFSGAFPAVFFNDKYEQGLIFHQIPLHHLHISQITWEKLYSIKNLKLLPPPSIKTSQTDQQKAKKFLKTLPLGKDNFLNVIIHPDAHPFHFQHKSWPLAKWTSLIKSLKKTSPRTRVFLSTGVNHPQVSQEIACRCQKQKLPLICLPIFNLGQYAALLDLFPRQKTVFVGLESMAASHLAPSLGLKSLAIASDAVFNPLIYGPLGGMVVMSNDHKTASVSVAKVREAIEIALKPV
ncbi:MAG TPA: glycosyltransferase family 9 protein [Clostridia bacterium]|nr:glycosyltransferase family 9 protein [Clostridia bacterium]